MKYLFTDKLRNDTPLLVGKECIGQRFFTWLEIFHLPITRQKESLSLVKVAEKDK